MSATAWIVAHGSQMLANIGIIGALLFSGLGFHIEARVRRAQARLEITAHHRDLWIYLRGESRFAGIFERKRDILAHPLTDDEVYSVNLILLHLEACIYARSAGIFEERGAVREDMGDFFSYPVRAAAWESLRKYFEPKFVKFVEQGRDRSNNGES